MYRIFRKDFKCIKIDLCALCMLCGDFLGVKNG